MPELQAEIKYILLKSHGTNHGFSFAPIFPILSTIPNLLCAFSVHLMNCYFPIFWYSHEIEKNTLRREKCNMRKKQDIIWERSTRWEFVEKLLNGCFLGSIVEKVAVFSKWLYHSVGATVSKVLSSLIILYSAILNL